MDLESVADELYGLRPEEFTAARDARAAAARKDGDRALAEKIGKLRRPSVAAWASNLLVREQPDQIEPMLRLGEGLRQAYRELDGEQLRELGRRQHVLINALSRQARRLADQAGHPIGEDAQREIEAMLQTVLADPDAAREWATGRLVRPFGRTVGFPAVSADATARRAPAAHPPKAPELPARRADKAADKAADERRRRLEKARREAEDAERDLAARQEEATAADRRSHDAERQTDTIEQRIAELREELRRAEQEQEQARAAVREARDRARAADRRVREARRRVETTAAQVERLSTAATASRPARRG